MENIWAFLEQTLTASVAAAVLLIAKRLFLDKLSPRWQYGVWAILALRVLLPAGLLGRSLVPLGRLTLEGAKTSMELPLASALTDPYSLTEVTAPIPLLRPAAPVSVTDWLFYLYAAGAAACLLWFFLSYGALRRRVARGKAPTPEVAAQLARVAEEYGLKVPRRVAVLAEAESAFVCGPLRPVLVLPERAVDDKVLLHELLHLKYGDLWAGVGMCVLRCLHWCNPLLWYCWNRAQNDCEALCDQRVLERLEGEQRRAYGVILLSMADNRYARAPGTTSMANGGKNIKHRIGAIARFKRYPQGVALGSWCVAAVLAAACLVGTSGAAAVPDGREYGSIPLAAARLNRPVTVAGALDTYAKAVLSNSPLYLYMVSPPEQAEEWFQAACKPPHENGVALDDLFDQLGYWKMGAWQAEWSVMNLMTDGTGGCTGTLFFVPTEGYETKGVLTQQVAVRPQGAYWTVEALSGLEVWDGEGLWLCPSSKSPYVTYVGQAGDLRVEVDFQCRLGIQRQWAGSTDPFLGYGGRVDAVPDPGAAFAWLNTGIGARVVSPETGDSFALPLQVALMERGDDPALALEESRYRFTLDTGGLDDDPVRGSTGSYGGSGMTLTAMPGALAVAVQDGEKTYICAALPEEVVVP